MTDVQQKLNHPTPDLETSFAGRTVSVGDVVVGTVVKMTGSVAFVNYGARSEGYVELAEFKDDAGNLTLKDGDTIEAEVINVRGAVQLSTRKAETAKALKAMEQAWRDKVEVEGKIVGINKGGYEVRVSGVRAFCPTSQYAERVMMPTEEVGKVHAFIITEYDPAKGLVVSRRAIINKKRAEMMNNLGEMVRQGEIRQGIVTQLKEFGAFVDLGDGLEGLIHVSEISHSRVGHPRERLNMGDAIEVKVINVDAERGRIGLSIKAMESDPWTDFTKTLTVGQALKGTVERIQPFGAFIKLAPGIDGLLHVSAISATERINDPSEVLQLGQEVDVVVEKVENDRKRISLLTPEVAERRKPVAIPFKENDVLKGKVVRVESYGVFLEVAEGVVGLIPNGEMDTERNADHRRMFPDGTELEVKVLEIDSKRGRIRLSRKALKHHAEELAMSDYRKTQTKSAHVLFCFF